MNWKTRRIHQGTRERGNQDKLENHEEHASQGKPENQEIQIIRRNLEELSELED